jgi:hypothetical protein
MNKIKEYIVLLLVILSFLPGQKCSPHTLEASSNVVSKLIIAKYH